MIVREVPAPRAADADILAALQGLLPVQCGEKIRLLTRSRVMDLIEESRRSGHFEETSRLLRTLEFSGEAVFRRSFSQMTSRTVAMRTSTLCHMLEVMAATGESRDDIMRRLLAPAVADIMEEVSEAMDEEKAGLLRLSLKEWKKKRSGEDEVESDLLAGSQEGGPSPPVLRVRLGSEKVSPDLRKYSRYFLKNLFRLNNIYGNNEFVHPPEVIEDYWEVVSPEQGIFHLELAPSSKSLAVGLYRTSRSFGLARTENPDYYDLVEFLASETRIPRIKGCRVKVHGATAEDEIILQEALSIESEVEEDPTAIGMIAAVPRPMSTEGLASFRSRIMRLSGIRAEVRFPVNFQDPECGDHDFSVLGFDARLDHDTGMLLVDDVPVSEVNSHEVGLLFAAKLLALSRQLYRDPARFPSPDLDQLDDDVHALMARAEREELTDELAREIVAKITVLDYYESLAKYSYALAEHLIGVLEGKQDVTFTIPRVLAALLESVMGPEELEEHVLRDLEAGNGGGPR